MGRHSGSTAELDSTDSSRQLNSVASRDFEIILPKQHSAWLVKAACSCLRCVALCLPCVES